MHTFHAGDTFTGLSTVSGQGSDRELVDSAPSVHIPISHKIINLISIKILIIIIIIIKSMAMNMILPGFCVQNYKYVG